MKALVIVLSLISLPAFAAPVFDFGSLAPEFSKFKRPAATEAHDPKATQLQPIRMAHVKARIYKINQEMDRNGNISVRWSDVCSVEGDTPVYDARGLSEYSIGGHGLECSATYNNKPVKVSLSTMIILYRGKIFPDEAETDSKYAGAGLWVSETANAKYVSYDGWSMGTRDLNATSFIGHAGSSGPVNCVEDVNGTTNCTIAPSENFQVSFEITDK